MFKIKILDIDKIIKLGVKIHKNKKFEDDRGSLNLIFEYNSKIGSIISMKESFTIAGYGRGLHYQNLKFPQTKIIRVEKGRILDVLYDPENNNSIVYGFILSENDNYAIEIPPNFAHGFIALEDVKFQYTCIGEYNEENEVTFNMLESIAKILNYGEIKISKKDQMSIKINNFENFN